MSEAVNNEVNVKNTENILDRLNNNKQVFKIIVYVLMVLIIGGGLAAIVISSLIPVNPQGSAESAIVKQFETPYIHVVTYLCMSILGILLILYILSVVYSFMHRGDKK